MVEGKIRIARSLGSDDVNMDIIDEDEKVIVRLSMSPESFGNAIVGRSEQKITIIKRFNKS